MMRSSGKENRYHTWEASWEGDRLLGGVGHSRKDGSRLGERVLPLHGSQLP